MITYISDRFHGGLCGAFTKFRAVLQITHSVVAHTAASWPHDSLLWVLRCPIQ